MKILITALNDDLNSKLDTRFGRGNWWYIYNTDEEKGEFVNNNKNATLAHGAGVQAASDIINLGVNVLITGSVGPKAYEVLKNSGIKMYKGYADLTIKENLDAFLKNSLEEIHGPSSPHMG